MSNSSLLLALTIFIVIPYSSLLILMSNLFILRSHDYIFLALRSHAQV